MAPTYYTENSKLKYRWLYIKPNITVYSLILNIILVFKIMLKKYYLITSCNILYCTCNNM